MGSKLSKLGQSNVAINLKSQQEQPKPTNPVRELKEEDLISMGYAGEYIDSHDSTPNNILLLGDNKHNEMTLQWRNIKYCPDIKQICSGNGYTIYCNHTRQEYYACGNNSNGQCGVDGIKIKSGDEEYLEDAKHDKLQFTRIDYFKQNGIRIKKVCTNIVGSCTFWISEENKLYCSGEGSGYKLGFDTTSDRSWPCLVDDLKDVIDVKSNSTLSMALCGMDTSIIVIGYGRNIIMDVTFIPDDIIGLIAEFYGRYKYCKVFVTGTSMDNSIRRWRQMTAFARKNKQIVKIDCTLKCFICLEADGTVWKCESLNEPQVMRFTADHYGYGRDVRIKDISCGANHILAADDWNRMFLVNDRLKLPQLMDLEMFGNRRVKRIKCGWNYSYIMTYDYLHFFLYNGMLLMLNGGIGKDLKHISLGPNNIKMIFNRTVDIKSLFDTNNQIDINTKMDQLFTFLAGN